jgi:hypothetical protein
LPESYSDFQGFKPKDALVWKASETMFRSRATRAFSALLDRGAGHGPERTEHAAIAGQWLELLSAPLADIEELTGIGRHLLGGLKAALRKVRTDSSCIVIPRPHSWPEDYRRSMARKVSTVEQTWKASAAGNGC